MSLVQKPRPSNAPNPVRPCLTIRPSEKGSSLIEFLLVTIFLIFPLLLGVFVFGMSLVRANQVSEVCRDAAHMYAYGVDFSQPGSQNMLVQLAQGLNMTMTGGNALVILSTVAYVGTNECSAGGYTTAKCTNLGKLVFVRRILIGNASLQVNTFGDPSSLVGTGGYIDPSDYAVKAAAIANNFSNVIALTASGQQAYMAETFVVSPDLNLWKNNQYWNWIAPGTITARSIF
jgi:hypothetical protein